jgi:hypothetical protein
MEINGEAYHEQQEKEECVICLDEVETEWRELACQHRYHKQCINNWIAVRATCPLCMKYINDTEERNIREIDHISIRRLILFVVVIVGIIIVTVISIS